LRLEGSIYFKLKKSNISFSLFISGIFIILSLKPCSLNDNPYLDSGKPAEFAWNKGWVGSKQGVAEGSSTASDAVERAVLNRIMVAHTDLLMRFGPDKVMQAAEEVAYNVGDVDEIVNMR
jgi:hypothetical protein